MKDSKFYNKIYGKKKEVSNKIWLSKLLLSIIFILISLIVTNLDSDLKDKYVSNVLEHNISFSSINKFYNKYFGSVIKDKEDDVSGDEVLTFNEELAMLDKEGVNDSYKINVGFEYVVSFLKSGIIVYVGEKDNLGNTVIVQGNDGVDIWYSNVIMNEYSLYDYVKEGDILGITKDEYLYLTIKKDGNSISYDEYF